MNLVTSGLSLGPKLCLGPTPRSSASPQRHVERGGEREAESAAGGRVSKQELGHEEDGSFLGSP